VKVFYTTDDVSVVPADGTTAADDGKATVAPGGMYCSRLFVFTAS